jgi:hypothetical protein
MMRHRTIRRRLAEVEAQLAPPEPEAGFWDRPEYIAFLKQMSAEGRASFRQLLRRNLELEVPEHEFDASPLGQCVSLTRRYVSEGMAEPEALSRAAVETRIASGLPEW